MSDDPARPPRKLMDVGGTSGGFGTFLFGLALLVLGSYLFVDRVTVHAWGMRGTGAGVSPFALSLIPIFLGVLVLFFDARIWLGWLGIFGGFAWMVFLIISRSNFMFRSTSLVTFLFMIGCFGGGLGLIFRSMKPR
jgi:hypothetical protein